MDKSHKTVSTNHNLFEEKGEPKRYRTEVLPLTSQTPDRWAKPAHGLPLRPRGTLIASEGLLISKERVCRNLPRGLHSRYCLLQANPFTPEFVATFPGASAPVTACYRLTLLHPSPRTALTLGCALNDVITTGVTRKGLMTSL